MSRATLSFPDALSALKAAGEETRLRIAALIADSELTVSDLTDILGQSQPRISRHLKLMAEARLVERHREGSWAFYRLTERGPVSALTRSLIAALDGRDPVLTADRERLTAVRAARAQAALAYFTRLAPEWDRLRSLHVPEAAVEDAIAAAIGTQPYRHLLDLGSGTGRMLQLLAPDAARAVGVDASHAMLSVARANLESAGLRRVELRQGDIYAPPVERGGFDLVVIHQVLHFLDDPARAIREACAALAPGGRLLIVDFAPHALEFLREAHAHRRLGFSREQIAEWLAAAGVDLVETCDLSPPRSASDALTVSVWLGCDRRIVVDAPLSSPLLEVA